MANELTELIEKTRSAHPTALPADLTRLILRELQGHTDALDVVRPAVTAYVANRLREETRVIETAALGRGPKMIRAFDPTKDTPFASPVTALLERWFSVGGRVVRWADATCDDLRERIAEQESRAADIVAAAEVYRTALAQMESAGVARFGDLFIPVKGAKR